MPRPVVAIVGRPNVGKSTLFNRMIGFRKSVVHDRPGVTRDRLYQETEVHGRPVLLIDTGGLEPEPDTDLLAAMRTQSLVAIEQADVILLMVDGRAGWTPADDDVASMLRVSGKPLVLVVNKIDGPRHEDLAADFYATGFDPLITISAEHGRGMYELSDALEKLLPEASEEEEDVVPEMGVPIEEAELEAERGPIRIAVLGRPNIGKSTLVNQLLGEQRHLVHDSPGTTMDPVDSALTVDGRDYVLVDTAGIRRKTKIDDQLERFVTLQSIQAIERCHVTVLLIDATVGPTDQDAKLIRLIEDRGRALILLVNKWDLTKDLEDVNSAQIEEDIERKLPHAHWAPHLFISAKTGKGVHRILPEVEKVYAEFDKRISTSRLNKWLEVTVAAHTVPQKHHRPVRLYYATQARVRPPTIAVFSNTPDGIGTGYQRYLERRLREDFGFVGTPIRLHLKQRRKIGEPKEAEKKGKGKSKR